MARKVDHELDVEAAIERDAAEGYKRPRYELPDPVPMAPPVGYRRQPSLLDQVREMVRSEQLALEARRAGMETFEESEDFEVEDYDPRSPWEDVFDPVDVLRANRAYEEQLRFEADVRDRADRRRRGEPEPEEVSRAAGGGRSVPLTPPEATDNSAGPAVPAGPPKPT